MLAYQPVKRKDSLLVKRNLNSYRIKFKFIKKKLLIIVVEVCQCIKIYPYILMHVTQYCSFYVLRISL